MTASESRQDSNEFTPVIAVRFSINGRRYETSQRQYDWVSTLSSDTQAILTKHPIDSSITIFYNPIDPYEQGVRPHLH